MSIRLFSSWGRQLGLWVVLALGLTQVGCAHPVMMEPSVVISSRIGYPNVYAQVQVPGPMVVMPPPRAIYLPPPPPRVIYAPQVYPQPVYRSGWGYGGYPGGRDWRHRSEHGHGRGDDHDRHDWRR